MPIICCLKTRKRLSFVCNEYQSLLDKIPTLSLLSTKVLGFYCTYKAATTGTTNSQVSFSQPALLGLISSSLLDRLDKVRENRCHLQQFY